MAEGGGACRSERWVAVLAHAAVICSAAAFCWHARASAGTGPFRYHESFEGEETPSLAVLASNARYTTNSSGITDEQAFSGRRSYKVDLTFHQGSYCFLVFPLEVPVAGKLRFSGQILIGEGTTGRAGAGVPVRSSPPILRQANGSRHFPWFRDSQRWHEVRADAIESGHILASQELARNVWGVKAEDLALYTQGVALYLSPRPDPMAEGRVVVYVDDLSVEGEIPARRDFEAEKARSWEAAHLSA